jgi:HK97 family phage major capsid protein
MDETKYVKFSKDCGEYKAGDTVELDASTAETLCKMGFAAPAEDPESEAEDKIEKALTERDNKIVAEITKALRAEVKVKLPAQPQDHSDKSLGDFLHCIGNTCANRPGDMRTKADNKLREAYKVVMSEGTNSAGGYTVPVEYAKELLYVPGYEHVIFDRVKKRPMGTKSLVLPALDQTEVAANGQSAFYGGVSIGFVAEGTAPSANTQPAFKQVVLTAQKLLATTVISNELLDDSIISIEDVIKDLFTNATHFYLDYNILSGSGSGGQMTGIINNAATVTVGRSSSNSVLLQDLGKMYSKLTPQSRKNAVWLINPLVWQQLVMLGSSGGAAAHFVWIGNDAQGEIGNRLFGLEVVPTELCPNLGTPGDVLLVDPRYYALGVREDMQIDSSPHYLFPADQIVYRLKMRVAGQPQITAPIALEDGVNSVSPFVQLNYVGS